MTEFGSGSVKMMANCFNKMDAMLFCAALSDYDVFTDDKPSEVGSSLIRLI